jgi:hypothetical protein
MNLNKNYIVENFISEQQPNNPQLTGIFENKRQQDMIKLQ